MKKLVNTHLFRRWSIIFLATTMVHGLQAQTMSLQQCIDTALANNRGILASRNNLNLYQLKTTEAKSNKTPRLSVGADYRFYINQPYQLLPLSAFNGPEDQFKAIEFGVPHNAAAQVQLAIPLFSPSVRAAVRTAQEASIMGSLQVEKSEEQVVFEVSSLYYQAQLLEQQILFADSNLVNTERLLANVRLLREQGMALPTDLGKLELQHAELETQRAQLSGKQNQVFNTLKFLMGKDRSFSLRVNPVFEEVNHTPNPAAVPVDLRMDQAQSRILESELDMLKKNTWPTVSMLAQYGFTGFGYGKGPDPFFNVYPLGFAGVQVNYPILNRSPRVKIAQKQVEIENRRLLNAHTREQNAMQIANALEQKNTALQYIPLTWRQIDLAKSVYRQTLSLQQQGLSNITDLLLADNAIRESQQRFLQAMADLLRAELELKKVSGTLKL